ncbi:hypothetical protein PFICI_00086 [Pestalotiopsis fici W106-1]|uniref:DUF7136 domain-containing protein n=1 Tax=Pestalotiopsis fici (strain W106-1 / CGMCC3.15140) TaxID=1229662 RepID=W3XJQ8_PESFW|nr:uncharacterized protein PFICI_00086 [Pestalotiopsis fici W106-1]ETS86258.1 hypothetical protein PFICI_00086 [Pestalotiopsis fici W106-1]
MMRFSSWASWLVTAYVGIVLAATNITSGIMEVDLVFPRNETYAPTSSLPVVFAIKNPELLPLLSNSITFTAHAWENLERFPIAATYDLRWRNFSSSDPYFVYYTFAGFETEDVWWLTWSFGWTGCTEESLSHKKVNYSDYSTSLTFTTKTSGQAIDLVAGTESDNCPADSGVAIEVASTLDVPIGVNNWEGGDTCAVLADSTPAATPCEVKIDAVAASSIAASIAHNACRATQVVGCDDDESVAARLAVGVVTILAAAFGSLGFLF